MAKARGSTAHTDLQRDLDDTTDRLDRLRDVYLAQQMRGAVTRALTTTYNARAGALAERRAELRAMVKATNSALPAPPETT